MNSRTKTDPREDTAVGMGQITAARDPNRLKTVLGSCIGIAIYDPRHRVGVLSHVVLPKSTGRDGTPGKFADTAVPQMLVELKEMGVASAGLVAKMAGGANMFAASGSVQVGEANIKAVSEALSSAGIRIAAQDVGGTSGRRLTLDCSNGQLLIEAIGNPPRTL